MRGPGPAVNTAVTVRHFPVQPGAPPSLTVFSGNSQVSSLTGRQLQQMLSRNASGLIEERLEGCRVRLDSKKQKTERSIEDCLEATFNGSERLGARETFLPFYVVVYPFIGINQFNSHFRKGFY